MIRFQQKSSVVKFARVPAIVISTSGDTVLVCARVRAIGTSDIIVSASERHAQLMSSQNVRSTTELLSQTQHKIFASARATKRKVIRQSKTVKRVTLSDAPEPRAISLIGGDFVSAVAQKIISVCGESMRTAASVAIDGEDDYTHEAMIALSSEHLLQPFALVVNASIDGVSVGSHTTDVDLLKQYVAVASRVAKPRCEIRRGNGGSLLSVTPASERDFVSIYKREISLFGAEPFEMLARSRGKADVSIAKSQDGSCELLAISMRDSSTSEATRLVLPPTRRQTASGTLVLTRSESGAELTVKDMICVDFVTVRRMTRNSAWTVTQQLAVAGQDTVSVIETLSAGFYAYSVELRSGTSVISLPQQHILIDGIIAAQRPIASNVLTAVTQDGLLTTFTLSSARESGDASIARKIVSADPSSELFRSEIAEQRDAYDYVSSFGVTRVNRDTGEATFLGMHPSGSFADAFAIGAARNLRYVISLSTRDPESLLLSRKNVSGSAQPYSFSPSVYRHPYALYDGTIVPTATRHLRHPAPDASVGSSLVCAIVDVTFQPGASENITLSAERISEDTVMVSVADQLRHTRSGYVIVALGPTTDFEIVGYVHPFSSAPSIMHDCAGRRGIFTYAIAAVGNDSKIDQFAVGPSVSVK